MFQVSPSDLKPIEIVKKEFDWGKLFLSATTFSNSFPSIHKRMFKTDCDLSEASQIYRNVFNKCAAHKVHSFLNTFYLVDMLDQATKPIRLDSLFKKNAVKLWNVVEIRERDKWPAQNNFKF